MIDEYGGDFHHLESKAKDVAPESYLPSVNKLNDEDFTSNSLFSPRSSDMVALPPTPLDLASNLAFTNVNSLKRRRTGPRKPVNLWLNSSSDYTALIPITIVVTLTAIVMYFCIPSYEDLVPSSPQTFNLVQPSPIPFWPFLGRKTELGFLASQLQQNRLAVVTGEPGIGKSAFVNHFASSKRFVFHVSAKSIYSLHSDLSSISAMISQSYVVQDYKSVIERFISYLSDLDNYIVIFDECTLSKSVILSHLPRLSGSIYGRGDIVVVLQIASDGARLGYDMSRAISLQQLHEKYSSLLLAMVSAIAMTNFTKLHLYAISSALKQHTLSIVLCGYFMKRTLVDPKTVLNLVRHNDPIVSVTTLLKNVTELSNIFVFLQEISAMTLHQSSVPLEILKEASGFSYDHLRSLNRFGLGNVVSFSPNSNFLFGKSALESDSELAQRLLLPPLFMANIRKVEIPSTKKSIIRLLGSTKLSSVYQVLELVSFSSSISAQSFVFTAADILTTPLPYEHWISAFIPLISNSIFSSRNSILEPYFGIETSNPVSAPTLMYAQGASMVAAFMSLFELMQFPVVKFNVDNDHITTSTERGKMEEMDSGLTISANLALIGCWLHDVQQQYDDSLQMFQLSYFTATQIHNDKSHNISSSLLLAIAMHYTSVGKYDIAQAYFRMMEKQQKIFRSISSAVSSSVHGIISFEQNRADVGRVDFRNSKQAFLGCSKTSLICLLHLLHDNVYQANKLTNSKESMKSALEFILESIEIVEGRYVKTFLLCDLYLLAGHIYSQIGDLTSALEYYTLSYDTYSSMDLSRIFKRTDLRFSDIQLHLARVLCQKDTNIEQAVNLVTQATDIQLNSYHSKYGLASSQFFDWYGECLVRHGEWNQALSVWRDGWSMYHRRFGDDSEITRSWQRRIRAALEKRREEERKAEEEKIQQQQKLRNEAKEREKRDL